MSIPALIISGYLGSGKTTLVGHLLREAQAEGVRLAIISNEFGDTGIDKALLEAGEDGFVELDGGCVCCKLSDALGETLQTILSQVEPDRLVLETSGVALPGDVLVQFWRPPIDQLVSDEVVVVVVDAERFAQTDPIDETVEQQLEAADLVLLNKCDLVTEDILVRCEEQISKTTQGQPVLRSVHADVSPSLLFPPDPEGTRLERRQPDAAIRPHVHQQFTTKELLFDGEVTQAEVLAAVQAEQAIRAKGFVYTVDGIRLVQGVGPRIELTDPHKELDPSLIGRVVIIHQAQGRHDHG